MEIALPPEIMEAIANRYGFRPARDAAMSTSVGRIGPLLRERLITQAEEGIEAIGITLLYQTTWIQSWFNWGQLHLEKREVRLREFLQDTGIDLSITFFDGKGYGYFKAHGRVPTAGMLYTDGAANLIGVALLSLMLMLVFRRRPAVAPVAKAA